MFDKVSYRRGVIEGILLYTLGRLGALITPTAFPDWVVVAAPICFLFLQFLLAPFWATRRIKQFSKRERLSKRFWLLGPRLAAICLGIDIVISLAAGMAIYTFDGIQQGPVLVRLFAAGATHLNLLDFGIYEARNAAALFAFCTLTVVCTRLAQNGFLRFTMPAGGKRVTL
ncbi:MAG TPA: hypothetical protein VKV19_01485 [Ktedonobacteraceae bacterium]|nr:hypothetical protein [Ktedonobacteraceae bacterium]